MLCSQCQNQNSEGSKFCTNCGNVLSNGHVTQTQSYTNQGAGRRGEHSPSGQPMKIRRFSCLPDQFDELVSDLKNWLINQNYNCQQLSTQDKGTLLQVAKKGGWRKFIGMSTALNVVLHQSVNAVTVKIGVGRWLDKAAVGTISMFILWPLAVTTGIGAWQQMKLPDMIYQYISEKYN